MKTLPRCQSFFTIAAVICLVITVGDSSALSQTPNPNNITGRWSFHANTDGTVGSGGPFLRLTQAPNGVLSGDIFGNPIEGLYFSATRRIVFVRKASNGVPFQFFEAHVSTNGFSIGGKVHAWNFSGFDASMGSPDFNFAANKVSDTP